MYQLAKREDFSIQRKITLSQILMTKILSQRCIIHQSYIYPLENKKKEIKAFYTTKDSVSKRKSTQWLFHTKGVHFNTA